MYLGPTAPISDEELTRLTREHGNEFKPAPQTTAHIVKLDPYYYTESAPTRSHWLLRALVLSSAGIALAASATALVYGLCQVYGI